MGKHNAPHENLSELEQGIATVVAMGVLSSVIIQLLEKMGVKIPRKKKRWYEKLFDKLFPSSFKYFMLETKIRIIRLVSKRIVFMDKWDYEEWKNEKYGWENENEGDD